METASSSGLSSALAGGRDTIVARATAAGRGALAVVRLSGPDLGGIVRRVCPTLDLARSWAAQLVELYGTDGEPLERGVAIPYRAPRSYTGEDALELIVHGSPLVVSSVIEACVAAGARPARPGEFSRRAVANGKMDLLQAEAVQDLIAAETAWQLRNARRQLGGELSRRVQEARSLLVLLLAEVEAAIDFPEQLGGPQLAHLEELRAGCLEELGRLLSSAAAGSRIRDGVRVVILGPVNAGKSTLFNHLLGRERAIVSPLPGTTRDLLEGEVEIAGVRVTLVDTAGIGPSPDAVEREGVRRAWAEAATAGAAIVVWPTASPERPREPEGIPVIRVRSKADLGGDGSRQEWLWVSTVTGEGLLELEARLRAAVMVDEEELGAGVAVARRHRVALERAVAALGGCALNELELAAEELRWSLRELDEVVGEVATDEVLDRIFAEFCIGK
jgi:tRNA modification GTPase